MKAIGWTLSAEEMAEMDRDHEVSRGHALSPAPSPRPSRGEGWGEGLSLREG